MDYERTDSDFESDGTRCVGWLYRPVTAGSDVDRPTLVAEATEDAIIPGSSVDALVERLDDVERVRYLIGHFDGYTGGQFETVVARQGDFLERHLDAS